MTNQKAWLYVADGTDDNLLARLDTSSPVRWPVGANPNTRLGDIVLVYRSAPYNDLAYILRAIESPGYQKKTSRGSGYAIVLDHRIKIPRPITLHEMQEDPNLGDIPFIRAKIPNRLMESETDMLDDGAYFPLRSIILRKNPGASASLGEVEGLELSTQGREYEEAISMQLESIEKEGINSKRKVWLVHGRNERISNSMRDLLSSFGLLPIEFQQALYDTKNTSATIPEILDQAFNDAQAFIVLLTPDDEARLRSEFRKRGDQRFESQLTGQARQNVLFEAGMAFGKDPRRTIFVKVGNVREFTNIEGIHFVHMTNSVASRQDLAQRLKVAGCDVQTTGTRWHGVGDFRHRKRKTSTRGSTRSN